jgi:quinol monooxygenase YgiN
MAAGGRILGASAVVQTKRREAAVAVGLIFDGVGITEAQYEQARREVAPDNRLLPGMLSHHAGPSEGGWCVIETWESQEALQAFFEQKLGQALQRANINVQPKFFQVTNTMQ